MVKQGQYAKSSRRQRVRRLKQRHQVQADRVIAPNAVTEFLLVRYHLTRGKQQRPVVRKTMQHFLTQWLSLAVGSETTTWSLMTTTVETLQQFNLQLPWQGYAIIDQNWADFQAFLIKEVPAVPLQDRLRLSEPLTLAGWQAMLSQQLAINALLGLSGSEQQLAKLKKAQSEALQTRIQGPNGGDWVKVASLLGPLKNPGIVTSEIQIWLMQLKKLTATDFD